MKLVLCRNGSFGSRVLRGYMGSRWSHAAVWDDEMGLVYDTTFWQGGCKVHEEGDFFAHYHEFRVIDLAVQPSMVIWARGWLQTQLGKGYDWSALLGILFRTGKWEDDDKWFCAEHAEAFRNLFSRRVFSELAARITPYHQDIVAP